MLLVGFDFDGVSIGFKNFDCLLNVMDFEYPLNAAHWGLLLEPACFEDDLYNISAGVFKSQL